MTDNWDKSQYPAPLPPSWFSFLPPHLQTVLLPPIATLRDTEWGDLPAREYPNYSSHPHLGDSFASVTQSLRQGFPTTDNTDQQSDIPRNVWITAVAELVAASLKGLRATSGSSDDDPLFDEPDIHTTTALQRLRQDARTLDLYFHNDPDDLAAFPTEDLCLGCLNSGEAKLDNEERARGLLRTLGQDTAEARKQLFEETRSRLVDTLDNWFTQVINEAKGSLIQSITSHNTPYSHPSDELTNSQELQSWLASELQRTTDRYGSKAQAEMQRLELAFQQQLDTYRNQTQTRYDNAADAINREFAEKHAQALQDHESDLASFKAKLIEQAAEKKDRRTHGIKPSGKPRALPSASNPPSRPQTPAPSHEPLPPIQTDAPAIPDRDTTPTPIHPTSAPDPILAAIANMGQSLAQQITDISARVDALQNQVNSRPPPAQAQPRHDILDDDDAYDHRMEDSEKLRAYYDQHTHKEDETRMTVEPTLPIITPSQQGRISLYNHVFLTDYTEHDFSSDPRITDIVDRLYTLYEVHCDASHITPALHPSATDAAAFVRDAGKLAIRACDLAFVERMAQQDSQKFSLPYVDTDYSDNAATQPHTWGNAPEHPIAISSREPTPERPPPIRPIERARPVNPVKAALYSWVTVGKAGKKPTPTPRPTSQNRTPAPNNPPKPSTPDIDNDTRRHLMLATEAELKALWKQRFGKVAPSSLKTKIALVEAYLIGAPAKSTNSSKPRPPQQLRNSEWTVTKGRYANIPRDRLPTPTSLIQGLQRALLNTHPGGAPHLNILGGRWSTNESSKAANFVLIFAGKPDEMEVFRHEDILTAPFGTGARLIPKTGFSCIRITGVPYHEGQTSDTLTDELTRNPGLNSLRFIERPRWLYADNHRPFESIIFTIFDPSMITTNKLTSMRPYIFGTQCRAFKFDSRPPLRQCTRCHKLGHSVDHCPRSADLRRCRKCGLGHSTSEHDDRCPTRALHKSRHCDCPTKCFNCRDSRKPDKGHHAYDPLCPLRKLYYTPSPTSGVPTVHRTTADPAPSTRDDGARIREIPASPPPAIIDIDVPMLLQTLRESTGEPSASPSS